VATETIRGSVKDFQYRLRFYEVSAVSLVVLPVRNSRYKNYTFPSVGLITDSWINVLKCCARPEFTITNMCTAWN